MNCISKEQIMPQSKPIIIETTNIKKVYSTPAGPIWALNGINLKIARGEFIGIIGRSGAGKTTLINMIAGLDNVTEGQIQVNGDLIHNWNEDRLARWRSKTIGIIYQNFQLMPTLSLIANVALPIDFSQKYYFSNARDKAIKLLDQVGLIDHIHKNPAAISGGQQQRVAIARALANDPELILADEPTGRLDSSTAKSIFGIFEKLVDQGKTILMVTHDRSLISKFSRVIWMEDGLIVRSV